MPPTTPMPDDKLVGALKNAVDRGETIERAKQSLINAGYDQKEIIMAAQRLPRLTPTVGKQVSEPERIQTGLGTPTTPMPMEQVTTQTTTNSSFFSKKIVIISIIISVIILVGAVFLGLFWNALF